VYCAMLAKLRQEYRARSKRIAEVLAKVPDFYLELKWHFSSWVPLVSRFLPSDRCLIWKRGSQLRMDSTLAGFENMKWLREEQSLIFNGDGKDLCVLYHKKKTVEKAWERNNRDIETRIAEDMKQEIIRTQANSDNVSFVPVKTWIGSTKTAKVGDYDCQIYEMTGFETTILRRGIKANQSMLPINTRTKFDHSVGDNLEDFDFDAYMAAEPKTDRGTPLLYQAESITAKNRAFKGTIHITSSFPRKVADMLPIFEVLSPTLKHFKKLQDFISLKLPDDGFPVKIEIPAFPTIIGTATFVAYEEKKIDAELFAIPKDYKAVEIDLPENSVH